MKKFSILFLMALVAVSCNSKMNQAMKSADKKFILETANQYFAEKKWSNALALYDRLPNLVAGTDDYPNMLYNQAYANYYQKNYRVAGHQFKSFSVNFSKDERAEDAVYMSALCYYEGSQDYNLDQTNTDLAINELQNFINQYSNSEKAKNINQLIEELSYKQEFKAYENARQYYKMAQYKAANIAFENVLDDFPATKLRHKIYDHIMKSRYELAANSRYDLKADRLENAISYTKFVEKEIPNSEYAKTAVSLREKLETEREKFRKLQADVEQQKVIIEEKQKKLQEQETAKKQKEEEVKAQKIKKDSADVATPEPKATFKIRR